MENQKRISDLRVCLIGPTVTKKAVGGVATFTESLADAFTVAGARVVILTTQADKNVTEDGTDIVPLGEKGGKLAYFSRVSRYLYQNPQDVIVGSTWYDLPLAFNAKIPGSKIHYLHGFGVPCDSLVHALGIAVNDKLRAKNCKLVANSEFTRMIHEVFYRTKIDAVIPLGIRDRFGYQAREERDIDVLYVGRIRYNKGVEYLLRAASLYDRERKTNLRIVVVGDGPDLGKMKALADELGLSAKFTGKVDQRETAHYYGRSKIFVSLDWKEPFGQTFAEAFASGCKVIAPLSGGQIEMLAGNWSEVRLVPAKLPQSIAVAIGSLLEQESTTDRSAFARTYSYQTVAEKIYKYYVKLSDAT